MPKRLNLIGVRFGRLKVVASYGITGKHYTTWLCECDCGEQKLVYTHLLRGGNVKSCGCLLRESQKRNLAKKDRSKRPYNLRHGLSSYDHGGQRHATPTFASWVNMRQMCSNPRHHNYRYYGGRGIQVHWSWDYFDQFLADMGEKPERTYLCRMDKNGNFEPGNCEWQILRPKRGERIEDHPDQYVETLTEQ
jgi:hypothetical protein